MGAGIALIDNSLGGDIAAGDFVLSGGPIIKDIFIHDLSLEADDILYLQSMIAGQALAHGILGEVTRDEIGTLRDRLGQRQHTLDRVRPMGNAVWINVGESFREFRNDNADRLQCGDWDQTRTDL